MVAGSRGLNDYDFVKNRMIKLLFHLHKMHPECEILSINKEKMCFKVNNNVEIVSGTAKGTDSLGEKFANEFNIPIKRFPAKWHELNIQPCKILKNKYGEYNALAGHNRNQEMAKYSMKNAMGILALFWDGKSSGSKNMKKQAATYGLEIYECIYETT